MIFPHGMNTIVVDETMIKQIKIIIITLVYNSY